MMRIACLALAALVAAQGSSAQSVAGKPRNTQQSATRAVADFSSRFVTLQAQYGQNLIAQTLEAGLRRSRDSARADSHPLPDDIREGLSPYFPAAMLDEVRYKVGDTTPDGLAGFAIRNGNAAAVTLIDTIVFKEEKYVRNLALWAHEMHHVEQYAEWGVAGFASRYAFGWEMVESEARARAGDFVQWYKDRTAGR